MLKYRVGNAIIEEDDGNDFITVEVGNEWENVEGKCATCAMPYVPNPVPSQSSRCPVCQHKGV